MADGTAMTVELLPNGLHTVRIEEANHLDFSLPIENEGEDPANYRLSIAGSALDWCRLVVGDQVLRGGKSGALKFTIAVPAELTQSLERDLAVQVQTDRGPVEAIGTVVVKVQAVKTGVQEPVRVRTGETAPEDRPKAQETTEKPEKTEKREEPKPFIEEKTSEKTGPPAPIKPESETKKEPEKEKPGSEKKVEKTQAKEADDAKKERQVFYGKSDEKEKDEARKEVPSEKPAEDPRLDPNRYQHHLENPRDRMTFAVKPDQKVLVTLRFPTGRQGGRCILELRDERRPDLPAKYASGIREEIDTAPNQTDMVAFSVFVPEGEKPQDYGIAIAYGPIDALIKTVLTIRILPTIKVGLQVETKSAKTGPLASHVDFSIAVVNEGNVPTAYRLRTRRLKESGNLKDVAEAEDVGELNGWSLLFDSELEDIPASKGTKNKHRFRMRNRGIWWWGIRRTERVAVVAVPVTDPTNAGYPQNAEALTATRWRVLPTPWFISSPILGLAFLVIASGFGIANVRLANSIENGEFDYVIQRRADDWADGGQEEVKLPAEIRWDSLIPWVKVSAENDSSAIVRATGSGQARADVDLKKNYTLQTQFRVTSPLGFGGGSTRKVIFVPVRTKRKFTLEAASRETGSGRGWSDLGAGQVSGVTDEQPFGASGIVAKGFRFSLSPTDDLQLRIGNLSENTSIRFWLFKKPRNYRVEGLSLRDSKELTAHAHGTVPNSMVWKFTPINGQVGSSDEAIVLTTDARAPILRLVFEADR